MACKPDPVVMVDNDLAVTSEPKVTFNAVCAQSQGVLKGGERILARARIFAPMGNDHQFQPPANFRALPD